MDSGKIGEINVGVSFGNTPSRKTELKKVGINISDSYKPDQHKHVEKKIIDFQRASQVILKKKSMEMELSPLWTYETGGDVRNSPALGHDGVLYVGGNDGKVLALDGKTGEKKWEFATDGKECSAPAVGSDGTVYFGTDNEIFALDGKTGEKKWKKKLTGLTTKYLSRDKAEKDPCTPRIGKDGMVYIENKYYDVIALDGKTGKKKWSVKNNWWFNSSPVIGPDGTVYLGDSEHNICALDGKTGKVKWKNRSRWDLKAYVTADNDGTLYVGSIDKLVYAVDGNTGKQKWLQPLSGMGLSTPVIGNDGTVYIAEIFAGNNFHALEGDTGVRKWSAQTNAFGLDTFSVDNNGMVYIANGNKMCVLNGRTGKKKGEYEVGGNVSTAPVVSPDGTIYVGSTDHKIYALELKECFSRDDLKQQDNGAGSDKKGASAIRKEDEFVIIGGVKLPVRQWGYLTGFMEFAGVK